MKFEKLAETIFHDILNHGGQVYIVGGSVRDEVLGIEEHHDMDVEVYHLTYEQLHALLSQYGYVNTFGKSFAIMQLDCLPHYDFALPRKEYKTGDKHQDFDVIIDPDLPLEKAIQRRDLTMNALMYDVSQHSIIDLCGGLQDIQDRVIRCVNPQRFIEDPLRVLRIAQMMSRFDMSVDHDTFVLCQQMVKDGMLSHLSQERVYQEYCRLLMSSHPSIGFYFLRDIGALPPYLEALTKTMQRLDFHPEGDVFTHTMLVLDLAALIHDKVDDPLAFMWSCLLHDIGKPLVTTSEGHAPLHNEAGVEVFKQVTLFCSHKQRQYIETMIMYHMHLMNMSRHHSSDVKYLRLLKKIDGKVSLNDLIYMSCCDKLGRGRIAYEQYDEFWNYINDKRLRLGDQALPAMIKGQDLLNIGIQPSQQMSELLNEAYDLQLQGMDKEKILRSIKRKYEQG